MVAQDPIPILKINIKKLCWRWGTLSCYLDVPLQLAYFHILNTTPPFLSPGWCDCRAADEGWDAADVCTGGEAKEKLRRGTQLPVLSIQAFRGVVSLWRFCSKSSATPALPYWRKASVLHGLLLPACSRFFTGSYGWPFPPVLSGLYNLVWRVTSDFNH